MVKGLLGYGEGGSLGIIQPRSRDPSQLRTRTDEPGCVETCTCDGECTISCDLEDAVFQVFPDRFLDSDRVSCKDSSLSAEFARHAQQYGSELAVAKAHKAHLERVVGRPRDSPSTAENCFTTSPRRSGRLLKTASGSCVTQLSLILFPLSAIERGWSARDYLSPVYSVWGYTSPL
jgi:hypothetical protein